MPFQWESGVNDSHFDAFTVYIQMSVTFWKKLDIALNKTPGEKTHLFAHFSINMLDMIPSSQPPSRYGWFLHPNTSCMTNKTQQNSSFYPAQRSGFAVQLRWWTRLFWGGLEMVGIYQPLAGFLQTPQIPLGVPLGKPEFFPLVAIIYLWWVEATRWKHWAILRVCVSWEWVGWAIS